MIAPLDFFRGRFFVHPVIPNMHPVIPVFSFCWKSEKKDRNPQVNTRRNGNTT